MPRLIAATRFMSKERRRTSGAGSEEVGSRETAVLVHRGFGAACGCRNRMAGSRCATEHLVERRIEGAKLRELRRGRPVGTIAFEGVLRLPGEVLVRMPHRVRERDVLREEHDRADRSEERPFESGPQAHHRSSRLSTV